MVQRGEAAPLPAPQGVAAVLLLALRTRRRVGARRVEPPLGAEVTLRVVLPLEAGALVVLKAELAWLQRAVGMGPHGVDVAMLRSRLGAVELMEGTGEWARGAGMLGDVCGLCHVTVHDADGR